MINFKKGLHDKNPPPYDLYRSDVFCLGMTLLHAATLTPLDNLYNLEKGTLNEDKLNEKITQLKERYSESIFKIIDQMLLMDDVERVDFKALVEGIEKDFAE